MYRHFLVLVDDSDAGIDTVAHAVALARSVGARITFAHLARESQDRAREMSADMVTAKAEAAARALGVPCESAHATGTAAPHMLANATGTRGCDLVCIAAQALAARDGMGEADADSSAAMFAAPDVPVLGCAVRRSPAAERVVAALYLAHRVTAGALCEGLAHSGLAHSGLAHSGLAHRGLAHRGPAAVPGAPASAGTPDQAHIEPILSRLDALRTPRLGPGDACLLSTLLRRRTSVVDAELGELARQHRRGTALFAELAHAVAAVSSGNARPARLDGALSDYAQFVWEYFGRKEGVIVPAAQRYLREDDWREIEAALVTAVAVATIDNTAARA
ncbi:universal stress protein [Paraburkholderia sp. J63]|uniref:universal stress protein n=1 Tax=Paraburkholderia sp. J63 TaxID=2805434 RepID=UPI002ABE1DA4|nr:universal stress protein [Paraburkholderia sp. J63]